MSTITSSSTAAQIEAAYLDNCSYQEDASPAKCRAFITACMALLLKRPKRSSVLGRAGGELEWDFEAIAKEIEQARSWLATAPEATAAAGGGVVHVDFRNFRD